MEKVDVNNLKTLINSEGWKVIKKELEWEIEQIENIIFSIDNGENNVIKYSENDLLKRTRQVYKTLLDEPETLIKAFGLNDV